MNISNSVQMPMRSLQEKTAEQSKILIVQFPVSSGQQHRKMQYVWVSADAKSASLLPPNSSSASVPEQRPASPPRVFPDPPSGPVKDISNIVTQRLRAMRKLQENPHDTQALSAVHGANQDMLMWMESKKVLGQFTGSTGVKVLSVAELASGAHACVKKDQLETAPPVSGGMGMLLLQKMGWRPGQGLGKNNEGSLEPLSLEIKMDKRGLVTQGDIKQYRPMVNGSVANNTNNTRSGVKKMKKYAVKQLRVFCALQRYKAPKFEMCHQSGPVHKRNFLFSVRVNGIVYKPVDTSLGKKLAKAQAAIVCLRALSVYAT